MTQSADVTTEEWILALQMRDEALKKLWDKGRRYGLAKNRETQKVEEILSVQYAMGVRWYQLTGGGWEDGDFQKFWETSK